jgi:tetratricopeptide (TPR) repeat protein
MKPIFLPIVVVMLLNASVCQARELNRFESGQLNKASQLLERNQLEDALAMMQPLLEQESPHAVVFQYACRSLVDNGDAKAALTCWQRGYELYPLEVNIAINLANTQLQTQAYQAAISTLSPLKLSGKQQLLRSQVRYMQGYAHYQLAQYADALTLLLVDTVQPHWWPLVSYSQLALEQWKNAKQSAEQWLSFAPDNQTAWQVLARAEMGLDNVVSAAVATDIAAQLSQHKPTNNLGLFGNLKAYNFAAQCVSKSPSSVLSLQDLTCVQYAWLSGQYQLALDFMQRFNTETVLANNKLYDDYYLLQGQIYSALKRSGAARNAWLKVGLQPLPQASAAEIKYARQKRNQLQGQALLLIGQSYWLTQQWPEAEASYRKLAQTPGFEPLAAAFEQRLSAFGILDNKLR